MVSIEPGVLYVVATPIGNRADFPPRAIEVLKGVDRIAAEDTRHSRPLLREFGIDRPLVPFHEHNERKVGAEMIQRLQAGESLALISDAGTPLVSDPGYHLTRAALESGIRVVPIPGPSAPIAALSVAGLPTDRFLFVGFLPSKAGARKSELERLSGLPFTLVFFEAPHRIAATLADMAAIFGSARRATLCRELTKAFETVRLDTLAGLAGFVAADANQQRGEIVLVVEGAPARDETALDEESRRLADILADELPVKQAAALASRITGVKKNAVYRYLVERGGAE